jgi:arylsulfatase A-like enzyme
MKPPHDRRTRLRRGLGCPRVLAAIGLAWILTHAACRGGVDASGPVDVVLCVVDALRADRLTCYGNARPTSPHVDALARSGVRFERAYTAAPWTLPSVASLLTSQMPSSHGAGAWQDDRGHDLPTPLGKPTPALAARLREHGYRALFRGTNPYLTMGCCQEVDDQELIPGSAKEVVDWALEEGAAHRDRSVFMYLHFMDVHTAHDLSDADANRFPTPEAGPRTREHLSFELAFEKSLAGLELDKFATHRLATYDGALAATDRELGRLIREFPRSRGSRPVLWILTSDHGEEFWEHLALEQTHYHNSRGYCGAGHGHSLFEELLRVPLVFAGPGVARGAVVKTPVSLLDVAPTILDVLGLPRRVGSVTHGRSLLTALGGNEPERIPLYAQQILYGHRKRSILDVDDWKLIQAYDARESSLLFHLTDDPGETRDRKSEEPTRAEALRARLEAYFEALPGPDTARLAGAVSEGTASGLRAVGYLGGVKSRPAESKPAPAEAAQSRAAK